MLVADFVSAKGLTTSSALTIDGDVVRIKHAMIRSRHFFILASDFSVGNHIAPVKQKYSLLA
jgi:hypothetical protein